MLSLNDMRKEVARYMLEENRRSSLDAAIFHVFKIAYTKGYEDGIGIARSGNVDSWGQGATVRTPEGESGLRSGDVGDVPVQARFTGSQW